jgi:hypothetical protein
MTQIYGLKFCLVIVAISRFAFSSSFAHSLAGSSFGARLHIYLIWRMDKFGFSRLWRARRVVCRVPPLTISLHWVSEIEVDWACENLVTDRCAQ